MSSTMRKFSQNPCLGGEDASRNGLLSAGPRHHAQAEGALAASERLPRSAARLRRHSSMAHGADQAARGLGGA
jgi:hypothetical protein